MGEATTCLMQDFPNASDTAKDERKVNPIAALRESVSFGRFLSESMDWERWSSFCHNRYLEEAEKSSAPGSVAQKKAYFEAHYKRLAAQKAAALLEQENTVANEDPESITDTSNGTPNGNPIDSINMEPELGESNPCDGFEEVEVIKRPVNGVSSHVNPYEFNSDEFYDLGKAEVESQTRIIEGGNNVETSLQIESSEILRDVINRNRCTDMESSSTRQAEKPPLKESVVANQDISASADKKSGKKSVKKSEVLFSKSSLPSKSSKLLLSSSVKPVSPSHSTKENNCNLSRKKYVRRSNDKKRAPPKSLHMSINLSPYQTRKNTLLVNKGPLNYETVGESKKSITSFEASRDLMNPPKTPIRAPDIPKLALMTPQSDNRRTRIPLLKAHPENRKMDVVRHSVSNETRIPLLKAHPENRKMDVVRHSVSNETRTPLLKAHPENWKMDVMRHSVSNETRTPLLKAHPENRKMDVMRHSVSNETRTPLLKAHPENRKMDVMRHSVSNESSSTGINKPSTQVMSPPSTLRSNERADKRKEYFVKFEEKLNAQRLQRQAEAKEEAENELRILRQSLGFRARPLPDFYRKGDLQKSQIYKTQPQSSQSSKQN